MAIELKSLFKALLFSSSEPLSVKNIQDLIVRYREEVLPELKADDDEPGASQAGEDDALPALVPASRIREDLELMGRELEEAGEVFRVQETAQGYRLVTAPEFADWVRLLQNAPRPVRLSPAALETLSVVAYRQPVTRAEMEMVRGVSVDSALNRLLDLDLVQVTGRADLPGRPIQYGTTERFLEFAGIRSLEELPASDVISRQKLDTWIREAGQARVLSDEDVGLPGSNESVNEQETEEGEDRLEQFPLAEERSSASYT